MTRYAIITMLFALGACAISTSTFQTSDSLEVRAGRGDLLEVIAQAGEADGWKLAGLDRTNGLVSFQRDRSRRGPFGAKLSQEGLSCRLAPGSSRLEISYHAVGSNAGRKYAEEQIATFKRRVRTALEELNHGES